jgi:hypothetical protein
MREVMIGSVLEKEQSRVAPASWQKKGKHGEGHYEPQGRREVRAD